MRILYPASIDGFFAQAGMSVAERALLRGLLGRGVDVRLVAFGDAGDQRRMAEEAGAPFQDRLELVRGDEPPSADVMTGVDALMLHSLHTDAIGEWLARVRPMESVPTVQYVHSLLLAPFEHVMWGQLWSRWTGRPPARLIAPSECTAARARKLALETERRGGRLPPVEVIPLGVDPAAVRGVTRAVARARLGLGEQDLVVLSVGRISPQKAAYTQLALAFHDACRLAGADSRAVLVLAGAVSEYDKPYRTLLQRQARRLRIGDRLRVLEDFDEADKPSLYAAGDVFVSLANDPQESFGLALLEALSAGLPVLATDWNGYAEVLPASYRPRLVPTLASHELANALHWTTASEACAPAFDALVGGLARLLADERERMAIALEGAAVADAHGWDRAVDSLVRLIETLAAERSAPSTSAAPPSRSMVDGLASRYLDDDPRLRIASPSPSLRRRREALWIASRPLPLAIIGREDRAAWMHGRRTRGRRAVLRAAASAGPHGAPACQLRERSGLPHPEADLLLLRLLRFGLLEVSR